MLRLAWPTVLSFVLNNGFRINDQYWVGDLGGHAQAAIGSSTILLILNFALIFLAIGGGMPLVARATGAGDIKERDTVIRHTIFLGVCISVLLGTLGWIFTPGMTHLFNVDDAVAPLMISYMRGIYLGILPLMIAPVLDNLFIGMGNTKIVMGLQVLAVSLNLLLNPIFIFGALVPESFGLGEGMGIAGAAVATCISRALSCVVGFYFMRKLYGVRFTGLRLQWRRMVGILKQGYPVALSIGIYAGVYVGLYALVIGDLGSDVGAGFGIGFNGFESVSYPFILGVAMAGASLVGRNLGAGRVEGAMEAVRHTRWISRAVGLCFALIFYFGAEYIVPFYTSEPGVLVEAVRYVGILAWSQALVAEEVVNEKILYGAGHPKAIPWISTLGNVARLPLGWYFAVHLGYGAAGLWWTINFTTLLKGALFYREVRRGYWTKPIPGLSPAGAKSP